VGWWWLCGDGSEPSLASFEKELKPLETL